MRVPLITGKKPWMVRRFESAMDAKLLATLRQKAKETYGCACNWCAWRAHNVSIGEMDPGKRATDENASSAADADGCVCK